MKKIFTLFAAILCGLALNAKTLYLNPGPNWGDADAKFAMYYFNSETDNGWSAYMTPADATVYQGEIPDTYAHVIFVRLNPAGTISWGSKWDQTADLEVPATENLYTMTDWTNGSWSVYGEGGGTVTPPTPQPGGAKDYFLKGYFNGKDIDTPTADEQFEGGILEYTFTGDASGLGYFFILVCEQGQVVGDCYMTAEYTTASHCTLVKEDGTHNQKMAVPQGTVTFYLYDNGDGSLELSTEPLPGKTLVGGTEGVENTRVDNKAYKTIINGQLVIIRGEKMFDATGRQL